MDNKFLEFWGNYLLFTAKGQKKVEDMSRWMNQGYRGFDELSVLFKKCYGLEGLSEESPDYLKNWKKASADFQKSYGDFLSLMGMVSQIEHMSLIKKYEELKEKAATQEETIKHLRMLLGEKDAADQGETIEKFQELVKSQADQFQELMQNLRNFYKNEPASSKTEQKEKSV